MMIFHLAILGVKLEHGSNKERNNTLITVMMDGAEEDEKSRVLFCSTDKVNCCSDELNLPGSWFLPNGSEMSSNNNTQSLLDYNITLGNQTMGLNISPELPSGIYHCEMMDRENVTHHLYAGIYPEGEGTYVLLLDTSQTTNLNMHTCNVIVY